MNVVKCENGHYYDESVNANCPYCSGKIVFGKQDDQKTLAVSLGLDDMVTEAYGVNVSECDKTIGIYKKNSTVNPIAGWLVCVDGPSKGRSFSVLAGRNFAGRSLEMDIRLLDDESISNGPHFSIIYDTKNISFYLTPGNSLTYLNDTAIEIGVPLKENDRIKAGNSEFIFINYCKEGRCW